MNKRARRELAGIRRMRGLGIALMEHYPDNSVQFGIGFQMNLLGLSMRNALVDETWDETAHLHAVALAHNVHLWTHV